MELEEIIDERTYQGYKKKTNKNNDYFTQNELNNLMQYLMQRQEKVIKNEGEI